MSEEMKNLNEQPEQAPVENKPETKLPLTKKQIGIIGGIAAAVVVLIVVLALVLGGGKTPAGNTPGGDNTGDNGGTTVTDAEYTLGLGLVFGDINAKQTNATIATVILDKDGKIVACKLDAVQNKYTIGETITFDILETKKELGDRYNMAAYGSDNNGDGTVKEWFEQAAAFEQFVIGMTAEQVAELGKEENLQFVNDHWISTNDDLLSAGCTIQIGEFVNAVVKACKDEQGMSFKTTGTPVLGLGINNSDNGTSGDDFEATIKMNIDFAATVVVDGKIVAALNDAAQPEVKVFDASEVDSVSVGKGAGILKTKRELKEDYGMSTSPYSPDNNGDGVVKEWYIQSEAFSKYIVGMTPAQVAGLKTQLVNNHHISTDDALLNAGCTIQITGIQAVVLEAANYVPGEVATEEEYKLGLGTVVSLESSKTGTAQIDATVATVVIDKDGKIVLCRIDVAQNKIGIADGFVELPSIFKTKMELGLDYGMSTSPYAPDNNGDGIVKEWYEQVKIFEEYVIGKTAAELEALELQEVNSHLISKDDALLTAGCTIQITDFIEAVVKACNDEQGTTFVSDGNFTLGVGINSYDDGSADAEDADGTVKVYSDIAASVVVDGKIVASLNDAIQPTVKFDIEGAITAKNYKGTKRELKEGYGMSTSPYSPDNNGDGVVKEWYEQSAAFSAHVVGMTAAEVEAMATQTAANGYIISGDADLLGAGCTIQITAIKEVVAESVNNAR